MKRLVIEGTVEERLLGVRRTLAVDQPITTGTQLCGARAMDAEESGAQSHEHDADENRRRKQRYEMLEELFGCSSANVHKA